MIDVDPAFNSRDLPRKVEAYSFADTSDVVEGGSKVEISLRSEMIIVGGKFLPIKDRIVIFYIAAPTAVKRIYELYILEPGDRIPINCSVVFTDIIDGEPKTIMISNEPIV